MDKLLYKYQEYRADAELEASPTNEAARGILDQLKAAARSAGIMGPENPSVMAPSGDLGPMPTGVADQTEANQRTLAAGRGPVKQAPADTPELRASTPQETQKAKAAPTAQESYDPSQAGLVESSIEAGKSQGALALSNTLRSSADIVYGTLDGLADVVSRKIGTGKPLVFEQLKNGVHYWAEHYQDKVSIDDYMTRVVGGLVGSGPALMEFAFGKYFAALRGFSQDGNIVDALYGAARRGAAGAVFKSAHTLDAAGRIAAGTAYMTGESVAEQLGRTGTIDAGETAEAAGVGLGMMASGGLKPGNKAGLRQRVNPETWFETSKQGNEIYKAEQEGRIDTLTKDLAKEFYTADLMRGGTALNDTSMVVIDKVNLIKRGVDDWILAEEGIAPAEGVEYAITGKTTTSQMGPQEYRTAIELYQGANPSTLVEEWMHRDHERLPASERRAISRAYEAYKGGIAEGDPVMSEGEFFAKGATDKFFADRIASTKAPVRAAWSRAVDSARARWEGFVDAIAGVPGAKAPGEEPGPMAGTQAAYKTSEQYQVAFHGSPTRGITEMSLDHIGSGEGNQAYGYGLYFASKREVAENYRRELSEKNAPLQYSANGDTYDFTSRGWTDKDGKTVKYESPTWYALESARRKIPLHDETWSYQDKQAEVEAAKKIDTKRVERGQLYEVTIPDDHTVLDWDKPLSEQPERVKKALEGVETKPPKTMDGFDMGGNGVIRDNRQGQFNKSKPYPWILVTGNSEFGLSQKDVDRLVGVLPDNLTGGQIYSRLVAEKGSQQAASEYLKSIGIPGLRYLDGTSRGAGEGSHNYVVFDDAQIAIDKTYYQVKDLQNSIETAGAEQGQVAEAQKLWAEMGVESPYFKKWFGDSKVVDAQGNPLVVYHGTGRNYGNRGELISGDVESFNPGLSGKSSKTGAPEGTFFFTDSPEVASSYTVKWQGDFSEQYKDNANVMPLYLNIKKPLKVSARGENWRDILYKGEYRDINEIATMARESGKYDGVIITRVVDHGVGKTSGKPSTTYIAFDPAQIKSATGNRGTFDASDPRIHYQVRPVDDIIYDPTPAPPAAQKLADDGRFNLSHFKSDADLLKLLNDVSRAYADSTEVTEQTRGVRPETIVRAEASTPAMLDIGKHLATRPGTVPTDVEMKASGFIVERLAEQAVPIIVKSKMPDATPEDIAEARKAILLLARARTVDIGLGAEAARSLGARRERTATEEAQAYIDASTAAIKKWGNERNVDSIADGVLEMIGPDGKIPGPTLGRFLDSVDKASTFDMILEARYMAMLANPATHIKNTLGNSIALMSQIPERALAEGMGAVRGLFSKGAIDRVEAGEALAMMYGGIEGLRAGATAFARAVRTGESTDPLGKLETTRRAITAENMGVDAESAWGKMIDFTAERLRTGNMLLGAEDDFFKAIGYSMELNARAHRAASAEGLKGQEFADRVQELVSEPPWDMQMQAMDFAHYSTFTNALGEGMTKLQSALGTDYTVTLKSGKTYDVPTGKLFRLAVPFFRTPANLVSYGMKRSPFAVFMPTVQQDLINGGAARDMAISRIALGSTLGFMAAQAASAGLITGGGPSDPKQKENLKAVGWQPYSIKVGDKWMSYQSIEPFSMVIGAAADIALFDDYLEENERNNAAMMVAGAFSQAVTSKTFMQGMAGMIDVLQDPDRYGDRYAQQFAASFVPSPIKARRRDVDPIVREVWTVTDALKNSLPGYSGDLYPRRNRYGEVVTMGDVWLSHTVDPVRKSEIKNAENSPTYAIDRAIMENNVPIPRPGKVLHWEGVKVELTPEEYDTYQMLPRDLGLVEALQDVVASEAFAAGSGGPDGIKSNMIREVFGDFREQAKWELVKQSQGVPGGLAERIELEKLEAQMNREATQ